MNRCIPANAQTSAIQIKRGREKIAKGTGERKGEGEDEYDYLIVNRKSEWRSL